MKYIISLFWSFIFSAVLFTIFAALFDVVGIDKKREEK